MKINTIYTSEDFASLLRSSPAGTTKLILDLFATKGTAKKTKNGRDSNPKYYGVKKGDGQMVKKGQIIVKTDNRYKPGYGVAKGGDNTIYSVVELGVVHYTQKKAACRVYKLRSRKKVQTFVNVRAVEVKNLSE